MERTFCFSFLFIVINLLIHFAKGHVGLTYPPARKYDLDFLDNIRTKEPCGMPKSSLKTSILSGSSFNVTWHLSYAHRGGFRLELMDSQERPILDLTPKTQTEEFIKGDPTAQNYFVQLPKDFTCQDCTIRLLRSALEWANNYRFWSCADVDIVDIRNYKETCSGHGKNRVGRCLCDKGFYGEKCQYENECETDAECHKNGQCIDLKGTALPRKQCFCYPGYMGEKCNKRNLVKLPDNDNNLDLSRHNKRVLSDRMTMYYRVFPSKRGNTKEIEFVLITEGTSYSAIGWRPASFDKYCKRWPYIANSTSDSRRGRAKSHIGTSLPQAEPESESESKAESSNLPEPEAEAEPTNHKDTKHHYIPLDGESSSKSESAIPESEPEGESSPKAEPESEPTAEKGTAEAESEPEGTAEAEAEPENASKESSEHKLTKAKPKPSKLPEGTEVNLETSSIVITKSRGKRSPEEEGSPEPEPEGGVPEPEGNGDDKHHTTDKYYGNNKKELISSEWAPKGDFHAMDCIDLIMGAAKDNLSRIRDYYTRDRSTPRLDTFWGGKEDITAATGWEKDGKTTLIFRRKVQSDDGPDHSLDVGEMHVIWARGQEPGQYIHKPKSGIERETPSNPQFYAPDEIKYHGHESQRGITRIDFFATETNSIKKDENDCENSWRHPPGCSNEDKEKTPCEYSATWTFIPGIESVKFTIETRNSAKWTGIGFSDTPSMSSTDAILGWALQNGHFFIMDTWINGYNAPVLDANQDIRNMSGRFDDGVSKISFLRRIITGDSKDVSLDECRYFIFPIEGGTFNVVNKKIGKHDKTPISSVEKVCIPRKCIPPKPPKLPPTLKYQFDIKLLNIGQNWRPPIKGTKDFNDLSNRLENEIGWKLRSIEGFSKLYLTEIKKDGEEGAVAKMDLMVKPNSELSEKVRVERALKETIETGQVGALQLDTNYLHLSSPALLEDTNDEYEGTGTGKSSVFTGERLWIVLGCVGALICLAVLQAGFTIYKTAGKTSSQKGSSGWRDYSSETNYGYDAYDEKYHPQNAMPLTSSGHHHSSNQSHHQQQVQNGHSGGQHSSGGNGGYYPSNYPVPSLPRPQHSSNHHNGGGYSGNTRQNGQNGHGAGQRPPGGGGGAGHDFYFMPSQRKYSGEVVSVYVDHNNKR